MPLIQAVQFDTNKKHDDGNENLQSILQKMTHWFFDRLKTIAVLAMGHGQLINYVQLYTHIIHTINTVNKHKDG